MKQSVFTIDRNDDLGPVRCLRLTGDTSAITAPGQFVDLRLEGSFLRRPISVCDWDSQSLVLLYKVVGAGTQALAQMEEQDRLDVLTGLGNGYDLSLSGARPVLLGGGAGRQTRTSRRVSVRAHA